MKIHTLKATVISAIALVITLAGCKRDHNDNPGTKPSGGEVTIEAKDLVVPAKFNFETEKDLSLRVSVSNPSFTGERFVIKIYTNVPSTNELIATGITDASTYEYNTTLRIPAYEEFIYIQMINQDGSSRYEKVKANKFVAALFTGKPDDGKYVIKKSGSGMTCSSGCNSTSNNLSSSVTVTSGTKCFTGTLSNANITVNTGTVAKICGSGTISNLTVNGTGKVYILEGATLTITNYTVNNKDCQFHNWSDSVKIGAFNANGIFYTYGKTYITSSFSANSETQIKNYGLLNINSSFTLPKKAYNYDQMIVTGTVAVASSSEFYNYCRLEVTGDMSNNNGDVYNSSYIKVTGTYTESSNGSHTMDDGAMLSVNNIIVNGDIDGSGSNRSKIKVASNTTINSNGDINGKIDLCDNNGIETNNGGINSPAAASCSGYICPSTCNPEGFGAPQIQDADSDGVADSQDEYPNDATRAFNSYYPNAATMATLAFEDLWPATGDYDYNDLVLGMNIQKVLNASNKVVDYKVKLKVRAIGASFDNGFGFQFDELSPSDVQTVTGQSFIRSIINRSSNNTEASQTKAVIICYDSPEPVIHRPATGSMFNTYMASPTGTSDTLRVNVTFASAIDDSKLEIGKFNPFIFANQQRGTEIHLGNFKPTSLATTGLFGTQQDRSVPSSNIYYKTANGMPWAILLPVDFDYPVEKTSITSAYNYFDDWAVSSGASNTDWYTSNPGNRNTNNIYATH